MIQYANIIYDTIVDGVGLRNTLYVCGCPHNCPGCHNPKTQDYNYGQRANIDEIAKLLTQNDNDITLSGGEPFEQAPQLAELLFFIKVSDAMAGIPVRNIWVYSGYTFEQIINDPIKKIFLKYCDVLVDGKFEIDKRDTTLKFRGSSNQRVVDVQKSLKEGIVCEMSNM